MVIDLINRLGSDVDASVCCLDDSGDWAVELVRRGVEVISLYRPPGFQPSVARRLAAVARRQRATVLHCHHYSPFIYGSLAAVGRRTLPLVFTDHGRLFDCAPSRKRRLANTIFGRLPGTFCTVSEDLKRHMVREGFPAERVRVIHNGIEPGAMPTMHARNAARQALGVAADRFLVGTVARLEPVKDLPVLIEAFTHLTAALPRAELVIVGDGTQRAALMDAARIRAVADVVHFIGARPDARTLLPAFDVYVNSSVTEGISVTILEAMAAGIPVVATHVGGTPEVVLHGATGVLVPSRNAAMLARAIMELAASPTRAGCLSAAARQRVAAHFTLNRMAESYLELYSASQRPA